MVTSNSQDEEGQKRAVWENNRKMIELHNEDYTKGKHGFHLEMNAFGDLTNTEFRQLMTGFQSMGTTEMNVFQEPRLGDVPKSVDWRKHGYVTPVKDQGSCGACWAFSAVGSLVGQMFWKTGKLVPLSEQNLVDCSWSHGNIGCHGGLMQNAFQYVMDNGGLDTTQTLRELGLDLKEKVAHSIYNFQNEEVERRALWEENMKLIQLHNKEYHQGKNTFTMAMNAFGDQRPLELAQTLTAFQSQEAKETNIFQEPLLGDVPKSVDWRKHGYVTPVKDQGSCVSCWAFSAVGSLEGQMFRKTGKLVPLSEQNLVDCSRSQHNNGCHGGLFTSAFQYIKDNGGLDTSESYPYEAQDGPCRYDPKHSAANITGFVVVPSNEEALMKAVATVGPISIGISVRLRSLLFYKSGFYYDPDCYNHYPNHSVLLVGYGEESDGQKYWLVKNSWGEEWGMDGYIKIAKDRNNHCSIATIAAYPTV
ncbi:Cathepsin L1 [Cricetulus griseus]|uniref:Cathepsin L1 n=1 Tax=Cricetulus griseus TaxID=10029 RepID=G3IEV9_CRIGR|nr:Cathepsin L1 [Cricetulus griseus]